MCYDHDYFERPPMFKNVRERPASARGRNSRGLAALIRGSMIAPGRYPHKKGFERLCGKAGWDDSRERCRKVGMSEYTISLESGSSPAGI
jgi:hypothetical protein